MIAALTGKLLMRMMDRVVIDVSGVGYEVFLSTDGLARMPDTEGQVFLHVHTQVRDDAIVLFGFLELEEKEMFLQLISVSGIGPKLGLAVLSGLPVDELCRAIVTGDVKRLTTLQGVGKKTAERICMELKDKVSHLGGSLAFEPDRGGKASKPASSSAVIDVISALSNLGYSDPVCRQALGSVKKRVGDETFNKLSLEALLRECLRTLA